MQRFERIVPLPIEVKVEKAEATLENGVLHITFPKTESEKKLTSHIKVSVPKLKFPKIRKREGKVKVKKGENRSFLKDGVTPVTGHAVFFGPGLPWSAMF